MKDRFSGHASQYAAFRPTYPKELYDFVLTQVKRKHAAWDCGTGNGQVARDLAPHFKEVFATDNSVEQIKNAIPAANIYYSVAPAEKTSFPDSTFDLITVGQAIHWLDIPEFYNEARRVARPEAVIAVWGYGLLRISPAIDPLVDDFYANVIGPYWDAERKLVDDRYASIPFPFDEISSPEFSFSFQWSIEELEGYLKTWSSVRKYIQANGADPVDKLIQKIRSLWNGERNSITFPLFIRLGRISKR